jgi:alpha-D-ribose 1-methylphosphonate 5-triphosphate synthase subunit PhnG
MGGDASSAAQPALLEAEELQQEIEARIAEMLEESREAEQAERDQEASVEGVRLSCVFLPFR